MNQPAFRGTLALATVLCVGLFAGSAFGQQTVSIGTASTNSLTPETVTVSATTTDPLEGFVLAIGYDTSLVSVTSVGVAGTDTDVAGAELVVGEIFDAAGGFTLGVVLDSAPPFDGQTIPAGSVDIANFDVIADVVVIDPAPAESVTFTFEDNTFNSPILNNILVQGGESVSIVNETTTSAGTFTIEPADPNSLTIEDVDIPDGETGCARILLSNIAPVQGFVLAIAHDDSAITLESITLTDTVTEAAGAEFVVPTIEVGGGTLGVVLDFNSPFGGQTIPVGTDQHIANFCYSCLNPPTEPDPATETPLTFADGTFGSPALDNVIVSAGLSFAPDQTNGVARCLPVPAEDSTLYCGSMMLDDMGNVQDATGTPGNCSQICVFYTDEDDNILGFQLAMCMPMASQGILSFKEGSFSVEGTILEAVGTEFLNQSQTDNEQTVGILLDALPPFDNQTVPQTALPLKVGCFEVMVADTAQCDTCYGIDFCSDITAGETLPISNSVVVLRRDPGPDGMPNTTDDGPEQIVSINNVNLEACEICIELVPEFFRGDCNGDEKISIADAAAVLGQQFQGLLVPCDDACDVNNDGKINLADSVYLLNFLFKSGSQPAFDPDLFDMGPPDPSDPTDPIRSVPDFGLEDDLGCDDGNNQCL